MPFKDKQTRAVYAKAYAKKTNFASQKARARRLFDFVNTLKAGRTCQRCEEAHPACLQFHHREGEEKVDSISRLVQNSSEAKILTEVAKCDLICANCHMKEHHGMRHDTNPEHPHLCARYNEVEAST